MDLYTMDKFIDVLQEVIYDWGLFELIMVVVFFPLSLVYIGFRMIQEWD